MGFTAAGIDTDTVTTTQQAPLGFVMTKMDQTLDASGNIAGYGTQEWVYVKVTAKLEKGEVCGRNVGAITTPFIVGKSGATDFAMSVIGVAQHEIASGSYGFVLRRGVGSVMTDASPTQGNALMTAASGRAALLSGANEHKVFGQAFATTGGAGQLILAQLNCPGS